MTVSPVYVQTVRLGDTSGLGLTDPATLVAAALPALADKASALAALNGLDRRVLPLASDPGAADIPAGTVRVAKNTTTGRFSLWVNDNGVLTDLLAPAQF